MSELKHLFSPIRIKSMKLANRAVMPPVGTGFSKGRMVSENLKAAWEL
jgi:2,4-dienoyl-CoA reductase-like NADH-dependent reductase (Old Yellow Enzyme family)